MGAAAPSTLPPLPWHQCALHSSSIFPQVRNPLFFLFLECQFVQTPLSLPEGISDTEGHPHCPLSLAASRAPWGIWTSGTLPLDKGPYTCRRLPEGCQAVWGFPALLPSPLTWAQGLRTRPSSHRGYSERGSGWNARAGGWEMTPI